MAAEGWPLPHTHKVHKMNHIHTKLLATPQGAWGGGWGNVPLSPPQDFVLISASASRSWLGDF